MWPFHTDMHIKLHIIVFDNWTLFACLPSFLPYSLPKLARPHSLTHSLSSLSHPINESSTQRYIEMRLYSPGSDSTYAATVQYNLQRRL